MLRYKGKPQMHFNTDKLNRVCQSARARTAAQLLALCVSILATGCSSTQYKRMVYDALRQQDCIINQLDSFCNRTFALDFYDYTQIRRDFMNGLWQQPRRPVGLTECRLQTPEQLALQPRQKSSSHH